MMTRRVLSIGSLLAVLACGDRTPAVDTTAADTTAAAQTTAAAGDVQQGGGLLDPNSATREQLAAIPGLDSASVAAVLAGRPYANMVAVDRALRAHRDSTQRKAIYAHLFKPLDLNTASGEEILLIPGVGRRMRHEFEEYRPYTSMEQFRREIGKYVDKAELARLERYVMIK